MPSLRIVGERRDLAAGCIAVAAAAAVWFAASPTPRITPDSASYLTGAEQIAEHGRFDSCTGPITLFAPGYSVAMAPLVGIGVDAPAAARIVNALATLALVLGAYVLARAARLGARVALVVAFAVAVSYMTLRDGALVWSEPLFCAILVWLLVLAVDRGQGVDVRVSPRAAGVVLLTWALLLTRHSGVFVLPAILAASWLGSRAARWREVRVATFGLALVALPTLWWLRNVHVDGDPFGRRSGPRFSVLDVVGQLPDGLSSLAVPSAIPVALRLAIAAPLLVAAALAWRRSEERLAVVVLTTTAVVYTVAVAAAATRTVVDPIDTRLLSPVLAPLAVLVAVGVSKPRASLERGLRVFVLVVVVAMTLVAPGIVWRGHETERTLETIPEDTTCAEWPTRYSAATAVGFTRDHG